jgi:hypothetical protein
LIWPDLLANQVKPCVRRRGDACELWCGVRSKTIPVTVAADALGLEPDRIVYAPSALATPILLPTSC